MRHRVSGQRLSRTSEHRLAMRRNLVASLFEHATISTTIEKAKEVKPFAEKLITLAKKGTLSARRQAIALLGNRDIINYEDGKAVKQGTIIGKLFSELGPQYLDRPGGYTRIIRLSLRRLGDNSQLVLLQLIGKDETTVTKDTPKKRSRRKTKKPEEIAEAKIAQEPQKASEPTEESPPQEVVEATEKNNAEEVTEEKQTKAQDPQSETETTPDQTNQQ